MTQTITVDVSGIVDTQNIDAADVTTPIADLKGAIEDVLNGVQGLEHLLMVEVAAPSTPASGYNALYSKSDGNLYLLDSGGFEGLLLPKRAHHFHQNSTVTNGNAIAIGVAAAQAHNHYASQTTAADADSFTFGALLAAGTYTLYVRGVKNNDKGILDWTVDGNAIITGQDWYNATQQNNQEQSSSTFALEAGWHVFEATVNGKNASSSAYNIWLIDMMIKQASD